MAEELTYGWLGTGRMGTELATRLLAAVAGLTVWNRTPAKCAPLVERGAEQASSIAELAGRDVVFVCVTRSEDLLEVLLGDGGVLTGTSVPRVVVDCSTVSVEASAQAREAATARGVAFLAAPVSGNPDMIREGTGALAISGPREAYDSVAGALHALGATVVHVGAAEESRLVKIGHNLLLGMITQALAEVTSLAEKAGIANADFLSFINGSVLGSEFIRHKARAITERDYRPTFTGRNLRKDFDIGMGAARRLEVPMPLTSSTYQLVQTLIGTGLGELDYVALYQLQSAGAALAGRDR
jgi:3-hydroxyisobutyrate dehydrogenase-like beta-hydroxyacid dehydrogenase